MEIIGKFDCVGVALGKGVMVGSTVACAVGVAVGVAEGKAVDVGVGVLVGVLVGVAVGVGVGVGSSNDTGTRADIETGSLALVCGLSGPKMVKRMVMGP